MARAKHSETINIRPEVSILSVLRHLNYRPWFAIAEFIDNSLQSFLANRDRLIPLGPETSPLMVEVLLEPDHPGRIVVRDNAAGIAEIDYARAFKPAELPANRQGLSEFGMGMKSAACWLAAQWTVRTSALGEPLERTIAFDVADIVANQRENLAVATVAVDPTLHYTEVVLESLHKIPQGRTIAKIKDHLASIYRVFLRDGSLQLIFNGETLSYEDPAIMVAPFYRNPQSQPTTWRKDIDFDFGEGMRAHGFAALRERGSVSLAGFALFRRNRLIEGSGDDTYRPAKIFGQSNSYRYQRLFGELHLDGFEVSHTKDGFRWEEHEDVFLDLLEEHLDADPFPLLKQAEGYRSRPPRAALAGHAAVASERTATAIESVVPRILEQELAAGPAVQPPPQELPQASDTPATHSRDIDLRGEPWRVTIEVANDPAVGDWVSVSDNPSTVIDGITRRGVKVRLSLAHPFSERFMGADGAHIEALLRMAAAIALAETTARESGVPMAGTFRRTINELLRNGLSGP
jgi:hypothetical protein